MDNPKITEAKTMSEFIKKHYPAEHRSWEASDGVETKVVIKDFENKPVAQIAYDKIYNSVEIKLCIRDNGFRQCYQILCQKRSCFLFRKTEENKLAEEMHQFIRSIFDLHQSIENEKEELNRKCVMEHIENNGVIG